ncbi:unnamed protein product [Ixodes hexagonus]
MRHLAAFLFLLVVCQAQEADKLTFANNHFGFRLLVALPSSAQENVFFSPYSVSTAMGMAYAGARGGTQRELFQSLGYSAAGLADNQVLGAYAQHTGRLVSTPSNATLDIANAAAIHDKLSLVEAYERTLTQSFGAKLQKVDFVSAGQAAIDHINGWVKQKTHGKIEKLFEEPLESDTRLVLLNAIYFKGAWNTEFKKSHTAKRTFYNGGVTPKEVDTMNGNLEIGYSLFRDLQLEVADLPYRGRDYSMTILLPTQRDGVEAIKRNLTLESFRSLVSGLRPLKVNVSLPKFKLETEYSLKKPLQTLGITHIFSDADLSGINNSRDLYVSKVVHKAVVEVNEEGSEAAAVTGVVTVTRTSGRSRVFKADHPFLFFIRNTLTNDILFAGQVNNL